jgi:hypothetical protein
VTPRGRIESVKHAVTDPRLQETSHRAFALGMLPSLRDLGSYLQLADPEKLGKNEMIFFFLSSAMLGWILCGAVVSQLAIEVLESFGLETPLAPERHCARRFPSSQRRS